MDANSRKVLWARPSGVPIYSSYHNITSHQNGTTKDNNNGSEPINDAFLDFGDDGQLYVYSKHHKQVCQLTLTEITFYDFWFNSSIGS